MKVQYKLLLALLPFVGAGILISTHAYPSYLEDQQKRADLRDKVQDNNRLLNKLKQTKQAEEFQKNLESEISMLRGSVPKSPELDLFMLDLDKMCNDSHVDLIAVEPPDQETQKSIDTADAEVEKNLTESAAKKNPSNVARAVPGQTAPFKSPLPAGQKPVQQEDKTALKKLRKEVFVTGKFEDIITLMRKLESYERITGVKQVTIASPQDSSEGSGIPAAERARKMKLDQPVMSFLMTLYYLP